MSNPALAPADLNGGEIRRRHIIVKALLVGVLAGLVASAFRVMLDVVEKLRLAAGSALPPHAALAFLIACGVSGAVVATWLVRRFAPHAAGSGIPHLQSVLAGDVEPEWKRLLPVKFLSGLIGIGGGLALGREGPTVQMGGAVGAFVAQLLRVRVGEGERRALVSAGAGAGLAAAFNAPLAGLIFVLEELHGRFTPVMFVAAFLASVSGDVVSRILVGGLPVFKVAGMTPAGVETLPLAIAVGLACGVLGVFFNRALLAALAMHESLGRAGGWALVVAAGLLVGILHWWTPLLAMPGASLVQAAIGGKVAGAALLVLLLAHFTMTIASYQTGAAGGIFAPLLVMGALTGSCVGIGASVALSASHATQPQVLCVLGMGALFAASVRAPLTGIVLMLEMTGEYGFMLPLLTSCLIAYGVAEAVGSVPIYRALRDRTASRRIIPCPPRPSERG